MPALAFRTKMPKPDNPFILRTMYKAFRLGHPMDTATTKARIGVMTGWDWLHKGEAMLDNWDGKQSPRQLGSHALFAWVCKAGELAMERRCVDVIDDNVDKGNWVTAFTKLERRRNKHWGRQQQPEAARTVILLPLIAPLAQLAALKAVRDSIEVLEGEVKELDSG